ncbi:MAG: hypothetical protein IPH05_04915 [Flavobacteriales bacterium]|jgi:Skp family chaperone for outer membrane proteins|nr:hypothetical protein [Flavobacteriales bacterium]MBK7112214.1 hypothetical protein [Flavobacteriales bacterium]MBK7481780.1 hypothetical protein [Flavobacteriales bacterium]MBK9627268.1 hypothetical protein [Flavobacteriales bacterium]MBP8879360.1 hypothetical protein [Flavobacteriales bacterium]
MKHLLPFTVLILLACLGITEASAQPDGPPSADRLKEIKAQKSAYITTQLRLSPEQAQLFWPIYNEMDEKRETLRRDMRSLMKNSRDGAAMTEAEAGQLLEKGHANREQELALERTYDDRFKKAIGAVKTLQLQKAEHDFNREVLRKFRDRVEDRRGEGGSAPR